MGLAEEGYMSLTGKQLKKKFPDFVKKHKIADDDIVYLAGENVNHP